MLGELVLTCDDLTPDAHACRLKLSLVTADSSMPALPWDALHELRAYLRKRYLVSAACRLSAYEEHSLLLTMQHRLGAYTSLVNRLNYLGAILSGASMTNVLVPSHLAQPYSASMGVYDRVLDRSAMMGDPGGLFAGLSNVSYKKPPEDLKGLKAAQALHKWLDGSGMRLRGGKDDLGFLFLYELMTGTVKVQLSQHDSGFHLACLLLRMLPADPDYASSPQNPNILLSILRVLALNRWPIRLNSRIRMLPLIARESASLFLAARPINAVRSGVVQSSSR